MVADACERRQRLGRDRVEQVGRIPDAKRERPPDCEVELSLLLPRDLAIHVLHLLLESSRSTSELASACGSFSASAISSSAAIGSELIAGLPRVS